jgi:hypothetical protein
MYIGSQPLPSYDYEDQGNFGTCVGQGTCHQLEWEALEYFPSKQLKFSPLFGYYHAKLIEGNWNEGTNPELAYQGYMKYGVCLEDDYPYSLLTDVHNIPMPSKDAYTKALQFKIRGFKKLDMNNLVAEIDKQLENKKAVNIGSWVFDNFVQEPSEGFIGLPEGHILGGHDYVIFAKDDEMEHVFPSGKKLKGFYYVQNSWNRQQIVHVAKDYINFHLDIGAPITQGAWIVDTGWVKEQPQPQPIPSPIPTPTPTPQPTKLYRVQVGAYSKRENADAMATQLKAAGFNCYIKYE